MTIKLIPLYSNKDYRKKRDESIILQTLSFLLWICLILFILFVMFRLSVSRDETQGKTITLQKLRKEMNTGDLLFVAYANTLGYSMRILSGSIWTHVGMVMRDEDNIYVMETADYSSSKLIQTKQIKLPKNNGLLVVPLDIWMKLNQNHSIAYKQLSVPEEFDRRRFIQSFWNIKQQNLDSFSVGINVVKKALFHNQVKNMKQENIICSELIIRIYQDCGVIKKNDNIFYSTSYLLQDDINFMKLFSHSKPKKLL